MFGHKLGAAALAACLATRLAAAPTLTTVQDVVYLATGAPYNGVAIITWTPFVAGDSSNIATQSVTVNVVGGNLMVQLVPSTNASPAGYYTVTFTSSGNDQFTETWAVPPSTKPLRVSEVLITPSPVVVTSPSSPLTGSQPISESGVIGLAPDLAARPVAGPAYSAGVAIIDSTGALEAINGNVSDCVHVDGSSGPCGSSTAAGPTFTDGEALAGVVDGANKAFTTSVAPAPASSLALYRNGIMLKASQDYNLNGRTVQFVAGATPQPGDTLMAFYRVSPVGTPQGPPAAQVLCSGVGSATSSTSFASLGTCTIAPGTLSPGDRVKISFDYSHEGTLTGFTFAVKWGNTVMVQRNGGSVDASISGWAEAGANASFCQLSVQSWGTVLGFAAGVLNGYDSLSFPIVLSFQAEMAAPTTDTVTLRNSNTVRTK